MKILHVKPTLRQNTYTIVCVQYVLLNNYNTTIEYLENKKNFIFLSNSFFFLDQ